MTGTGFTAAARGRARTAYGSMAGLARDGALAGLVANTGLIGVSGAMMSTSGSLFLAEGIGVGPLLIGLFFLGRGVLGVLSGLAFGALSDRIGDRRLLLALCTLLSAVGTFAYVVVRDYYLLFAFGAVFFALGSACFPQLLAYTREFADTRALDATFFNSLLRALTSMAWVVGPPIGFLLIDAGGFGVLYLTVTAMYVLACVLCLWLLPKHSAPAAARGPRTRGNPFTGLGRSSWTLLVATVLLLAVNSVYQIDIALFVTEQLDHGTGFTGLLLGLASALEIPVMMYLGARADRIGKRRLVFYAACCATVFFAALPLAASRPALLALQALNAFFMAVVLSIPVTILQEALPDRVGAASSLFTGAFQVGVMLGGATAGVVIDRLGYGRVFWVCALLAALAAVLLTTGHEPAADAARVP
ncbi:MFS transporter [Streptomyces sp. MBT65]|uniref:MFS transporter n=1 Tax=Streptomyces sp. MBT65 TaxID=1488395 RepID=UPI00190D13B4|nr:MFS transporter [Streptomyces sp. MBT65]MBK3580970.1 MFS transporter [Streptomyces sp. MBT65]